MNDRFLLFAGLLGGAALTAGCLVGGLIRLAPRIGLLDRPNERSLHTRVTPRGGGLALVIVVAVALGLWLARGDGWPAAEWAQGAWRPVAIYLGAAVFIGLVSLRDDFKSLGVGVRFACQFIAAAAAIEGAGQLRVLAIPGWGIVELGSAGVILTALWIVGLTNVYNFMDGIDGIAGVQGLSAGLAWAAAGLWLGVPVAALLGVVLAGGALGFLRYNWSPARIFMGDVGSAFLGYSFAVLPLLWLRSEPPSPRAAALAGEIPVFALLVVWPFVGDGFFTFVRRARRGEPVWKAHRSHLYQRLVQSGWTHARVSTLYGIWCLALALTGLGWLARALPSAVVWVMPLGTLGAMLALVTHCEQRAQEKHG